MIVKKLDRTQPEELLTANSQSWIPECAVDEVVSTQRWRYEIARTGDGPRVIHVNHGVEGECKPECMFVAPGEEAVRYVVHLADSNGMPLCGRDGFDPEPAGEVEYLECQACHLALMTGQA